MSHRPTLHRYGQGILEHSARCLQWKFFFDFSWLTQQGKQKKNRASWRKICKNYNFKFVVHAGGGTAHCFSFYTFYVQWPRYNLINVTLCYCFAGKFKLMTTHFRARLESSLLGKSINNYLKIGKSCTIHCCFEWALLSLKGGKSFCTTTLLSHNRPYFQSLGQKSIHLRSKAGNL